MEEEYAWHDGPGRTENPDENQAQLVPMLSILSPQVEWLSVVGDRVRAGCDRGAAASKGTLVLFCMG